MSVSRTGSSSGGIVGRGIPNYMKDWSGGNDATIGFVGETTTIDRNANEYYFDGSNMVAVADNVARIHSAYGYGAEPAVANLWPYKHWVSGGNWAWDGNDLEYSGSAKYSMTYAGAGAATVTLDADSVRSEATATSVKIVVTNAGASATDIKFSTNATNMPLYVTDTTKYTQSIYIKSSAAVTVPIEFEQADGTDIATASTISVTTSWDKKEKTFTATATVTDGRITLHLGALGTTTFWIDCFMMEQSSFASDRWIGGDAAVGDNVVVNGDMAAVSEGGELATGLLTIGKTYKITARADGDFIAAGSPNNNVNTYFKATTTGVGLLDAGDKVVPITLDSWTAGDGCGPDAVAGALTGKASVDGSQAAAGTLRQAAILTAGTAYRQGIVATRTAGSFQIKAGTISSPAISASGTYYYYNIADGVNLDIVYDADFIGTFDTVTSQSHGSVGVTESAKLTYTTPAGLFNSTGSMAVKWQVGAAEANLDADFAIVTLVNSVTSILWYDASENKLTASDGTNTAAIAVTLVADTEYQTFVTWASGANGLKINNSTAAGSLGVEVAADFDDAFTTTGDKVYAVHTPTANVFVEWVKFFTRVLSDNEKKALPF